MSNWPSSIQPPRRKFNFSEDVQFDMANEAVRMWRRNQKFLHTLTACARFKVTPRQASAIINYTVFHLRFDPRGLYSSVKLTPTKNGQQITSATQAMLEQLVLADCWYVPALMDEEGDIYRLYIFLLNFGGRLIYREQLEEDSPYSLSSLLAEKIGVDFCKNLIDLLYQTDTEVFRGHTWEEFQRCLKQKLRYEMQSSWIIRRLRMTNGKTI